MIKHQLFEYAIIWHPTEKQYHEGARVRLVKGLTQILAANKEQVKTLASREIPEDLVEEISQVEILVRPF